MDFRLSCELCLAAISGLANWRPEELYQPDRFGTGHRRPAGVAGDRAHRGQSVLYRGDGAGAVRRGALVRNGAVKVTRSLSQLRLPPTVQGILASRIDRLPAEQKELLQTLAVIGRESSLGLIRKVADKAEPQLERMLADLLTAEFIYEQPVLTGAEYIFKHALTQEVAYNSLLIGRRLLTGPVALKEP
jgi:hypothetical protein